MRRLSLRSKLNLSRALSSTRKAVIDGEVEVVVRGQTKRTKSLEALPRSLLEDLKWLAQRDALGQDAVLVTPPGERSRARQVAMAFGELVESEVYYVGISADTSEGDLRQRREIDTKRGSYFVDAPPVVAAKRGGLLILDGLERAERNVLPTLNNLLQNRSMSLDDGRLLLPEASRGGSSVDRVPATFRVIAITAPCPPFKGRPLDPPLRSRLQARFILPAAPTDLPLPLVQAVATLAEAQAIDLEHFGNDDEKKNLFPVSTAALLRRRHRPSSYLLRMTYPALDLPDTLGDPTVTSRVAAMLPKDDDVVKEAGFQNENLWLSSGQRKVFEAAQAEIQEQHQPRVLLIGKRGGSKTAMATALLEGTEYHTHALHEDMTSRDLVQRRIVEEDGASSWADAPFTRSCRTNGAVLLDGIHRLPPGSLVAGLGRACEDGVLDLPDGSTIDATTIVIATAELADVKKWLTPDVAAMFCTFVIPEWETQDDIALALEALVPNLSEERRSELARITEKSRLFDNDVRLSTRALIRAARRLAGDQNLTVETAVRDVLLVRYLASRLQDDVASWFPKDESSIDEQDDDDSTLWRVVSNRDEQRVIVSQNGTEMASLEVRSPQRRELVPELGEAYVPSKAAERDLGEIAMRLARGEKFIALIGSQGVGKNVLVDRLLELVSAECEYQQLHRDSTVTSLTTTPVVDPDGRLRYIDAPLVRAALKGRIAVLDEVDKAPVDVVAWLKGLVADGELALTDGRTLKLKENVHPNFALFVLANRPGYPFQGNHFFRACGDCFAAVAVENPSLESELEVLQRAAPDLDEETRRRLAASFAELRMRFETGSVAYPFSLREAVNVARSLAADPKAGHAEALANVLRHDGYSPKLDVVLEVLEAHGFDGVRDKVRPKPSSSQRRETMRIQYEEEEKVLGEGGSSRPRFQAEKPKYGKVDPTGAPHVGGNTWAGGSGGSDTAGLGGRGGPFRLWDGKHVPHQISDDDKADVPAEVLEEARRQAREAHKEKLKEIDGMTERDFEEYSSILGRVQAHVAALRDALRNAKADGQKRGWLKRRADGDVDDSRIVDGVAGDPLVFKRRGKKHQDDDPEQLPRSVMLLVDVSASMYRFQMIDGRLQRMLEAVLLFMEALDGIETFEYAIKGHSGSDDDVTFVPFGEPPKNRGDRLKVLKRMVAHTMYCDSGDTTIPATRRAIDALQQRRRHRDDDDDLPPVGLLIACSDANFRRYGLDPTDWSNALLAHRDDVEAYAILVGSLQDEATRIANALPPGRGHVALNMDDDDDDDLVVLLLRVLRHAGIVS